VNYSYFSQKRGRLALGKFADLALLSKDYLSVPVAEIGGIQSLLTMVGGRVVYADGPIAKYEARR
jgi:predicted amidohydrolase YtcJ